LFDIFAEMKNGKTTNENICYVFTHSLKKLIRFEKSLSAIKNNQIK